tara:strand:+ start:518 stop:2221 length:1704 start_codon:yes stop_codon:yes gene_type:complete
MSVQDPKKIEEAQKLANQAIKEGNSLTRAYGQLLKSNLKEVGFISAASKNTADIITRQIQDQKQNLSTSEKLKNVARQIEETEGEIARHKKNGHSSIKEELQDNLKGLRGEKESLSAQSKKSELMGKLVGKAKAFAKAITVGAIFTALVSIAQKFAGQIDNIGKQFGSLNVLGDNFTNELLSSQEAVVGIGASLEDVIATTNELSSEFGLSIDEAANLSAQVIDTARAVGLSNEEAAKLSGILQTTSGLSGAQAERLTEGAFQLAGMNRVNPSAVLKDMASSSEAFAMFSEDGGDNLAKAAVQARALGLSLDTTSKIAEGLLDFENSINKEVEASVLIGKQLNFQKARELALSNDIEGAVTSLVGQLGSEAEFNKLNVIQRKALADSIGVSVADMAKMVANQDKSNILAGETAKSFADIIGKDAMSELTATMNELKIFGVAIANTLGPPLMLIAKALNFALVPLGNVVSSISQGIRGVDDFKSGPGGITTMMGPAGVFSLNPRDSVLATTNPISVNDFQSGPAGSMNVGGGNMNINVSTGGISGRDIPLLAEVEFDGSGPESLSARG